MISIYVFDQAEVLFKQGFNIPSAGMILILKKSSIDFENLFAMLIWKLKDIFMCGRVLAWVSLCEPHVCPWDPEEGIGTPVTGVTVGREPLRGCWSGSSAIATMLLSMTDTSSP